MATVGCLVLFAMSSVALEWVRHWWLLCLGAWPLHHSFKGRLPLVSIWISMVFEQYTIYLPVCHGALIGSGADFLMFFVLSGPSRYTILPLGMLSKL